MTDYKLAEKLVYDYYNTNPDYTVTDVTDNPYYWTQDIDLIATNNLTGYTANIEVKYDSKINQTGNLYIEYYNPRSKDNKGWINFTKSDLIYYVDATNNKAYVIDTANIRQYINNNANIKTATTKDGSRGYLVPVDNIALVDTIQL